MASLSELQLYGGQLRALKEAERLLARKPVLTVSETVQLAEIRARKKVVKRQLKNAVAEVQQRLPI